VDFVYCVCWYSQPNNLAVALCGGKDYSTIASGNIIMVMEFSGDPFLDRFFC
jgi:hypothetical protein